MEIYYLKDTEFKEEKEMSENKKPPQDVLDLGEVEAIIITDDNGNLVGVVDNHHIIEHEGYKVIIDKKLS